MKRLVALAVVAFAVAVPTAGGAASTSKTCTYKAPGLDIYLRLSGTGVSPAACQWFNRGVKGTVWKGQVPANVSGVWVARGRWRARLTVYAVDGQLGRLYCANVESDLASDFTRIK